MRTATASSLLAGALAAVTATSTISCNIECGEGTVEKDGTCVPGTPASGATCGMGTKLGPNGTCIPDEVVVCDVSTTQEQVDPDTGVVTCVGTGGSLSSCTTERQCPTPQTGKLTLCGRIYDTQTDLPISAATPTGMLCGAGGAADGPCALDVKFYDAVAFSMNPTGAMPIPPATFDFDDCGRYVAQNLTRPSLGFIGMGVDDKTGLPDNMKLTGVATANTAAAPARAFRAYATRNATDTAWTSTSGIGAQSFATRGVLAAVFRYQGAPRAGVAARRNMNPIPNDDFYFSDSGISRNTVAPAQMMTGANGTALIINVASATNHDGLGGEPAGCRWPENLAAAITGVVFVQLKEAETTAGAVCP